LRRLGLEEHKAFFLGVVTLTTFLILALPLVQVNEVSVDGVEYLFPEGGEIVVELKYLHSVELAKIVETYVVTGCEVRLAEFRWPGYGAGLASTPEDALGQIVWSDGGFAARNISITPGNALRLDMKHRVNATLTVNGVVVSSKIGVEIRPCVRVPIAKILRHLLTHKSLSSSS
jgi:hypothetical protein